MFDEHQSHRPCALPASKEVMSCRVSALCTYRRLGSAEQPQQGMPCHSNPTDPMFQALDPHWRAKQALHLAE